MGKLKKNIKYILNKITGRKLHRGKLPKNEKIQKVLVISLYFTGDVLFHTAVIEALGKIYPNSELDVWIKSKGKSLFLNDSRINNVILFDNLKTSGYGDSESFSLRRTIDHVKQLRRARYDLIIDLTGKYSTALTTLFAKPLYSIGLNYDFFGFCYDKFVYINTASEPGHLIEKYLNVLKDGLELEENEWIKVRNDVRTKPYIYSDKESSGAIDNLFRIKNIKGKDFVVIHLTSGWAAKELPPGIFGEVIDFLEGIGYKYFFIGDKNDENRLNELSNLITDNSYSLEDKFLRLSLIESAELIRRSALLIGSDSAPLHIAGAFDVPSLGLFGPTNPDFSNPLGDIHKYIYHRLPCSASESEQYCTRSGGFTCPLYECMNSIRSNEIIDQIEKLLGVSRAKLI